MRARLYLPPAAWALVFVTGLAAGWSLRPASRDQESRARWRLTERQDQTSRTEEGLPTSPFPATRKLQPPTFAARLDEAMGLGNRFKKARAMAAIADDLTASEVSGALDWMALIGDYGSGIDAIRNARKNGSIRWAVGRSRTRC